MAVDERRRHALHTAAQNQLGDEEGDTLMELLPPVGWADVATKHDLNSLRTATKQDFEVLRTETKQDLAMLRTETKQDLAMLRTELLGAMHAEFRRQTMHLMTILVPSLLGTIGAAFTAARIG